jgi:hypothetical protein
MRIFDENAYSAGGSRSAVSLKVISLKDSLPIFEATIYIPWRNDQDKTKIAVKFKLD